MPALLIRQRVTDFATWKAGFDEQEPTRRAHGCQCSRIFRNVADPAELLILLKWDNADRAWLFAQSDDLREELHRAEVVDWPDLWSLGEPNQPGGDD